MRFILLNRMPISNRTVSRSWSRLSRFTSAISRTFRPLCVTTDVVKEIAVAEYFPSETIDELEQEFLKCLRTEGMRPNQRFIELVQELMDTIAGELARKKAV